MIAVPENDLNGLAKGEDILTFDVSDGALERAPVTGPCNTVAPPISRQTAC
jgi:hypothetical protein